MKLKEQMMLEGFFKEIKVWYPGYWGFDFVGRLFIFLTMIQLLVPFQLWEGNYKPLFIVFYMELLGVEFCMKKYCHVKEGGKVKRLSDFFRYLPVAHKQLLLFRLKKLFKFCFKLFIIGLFCQITPAALFMHTLSFMNVLLPFTFCFLSPLIILGCIRILER